MKKITNLIFLLVPISINLLALFFYWKTGFSNLDRLTSLASFLWFFSIILLTLAIFIITNQDKNKGRKDNSLRIKEKIFFLLILASPSV